MGSQALQRAPPVPHWVVLVEVTQVAPLQQPDAQLAAVQPVQTWLVQLCAPHDAQLVPPVPHWVVLVPGWHTPEASQQPVGQLVASQVQLPLTQRWPAWHWAPDPHAQAPLVQRSARALQVLQVEAEAPQAAALWLAAARHWAPEQQPPGQDAAVQAQEPEAQVCPAAQAAPLPHLQTPVEQALVLPEQGVQAWPPMPQFAALWADCTMHWPALQQPLGQLAALHTQVEPTQAWPAAQAALAPHAQAPAVQRSPMAPQLAQLAPAAAQAVAVVGATQAVPLQQPVGQLAALHTQLPP